MLERLVWETLLRTPLTQLFRFPLKLERTDIFALKFQLLDFRLNCGLLFFQLMLQLFEFRVEFGIQ